MNTIKKLIKQNRPNLSDSSIKTYVSILKNLYFKVFPSDEDISISKYDDKADEVLKYLKSVEPLKRKTVLASLVVLTGNDKYQKQMMEDIEDSKSEIYNQIKNDKQNESWIDTQEISEFFEIYKTQAKKLYRIKEKSMEDLQQIQNFIILALLSGLFIPPRRLKDYCDFKIIEPNQNVDNYKHKNTFVFNSFKTSKTYIQQVVPIPSELGRIINRWIKVNPTEYLLFDNNGNKLSNVQLVQRLNKIFNGNISVNQLRHTYMTDKYKSTSEQNKMMAEDFKMMGSSIAQECVYIKIK
jgi:integrase